MILQTKMGHTLPEGAVRITREEALKHQKEVVDKWPSVMQVLFLKYGYIIGSGSTVICSAVIMKHVSTTYRLGIKPALLSFFPALILPGYVSLSLTEKFITNNVLVMGQKCPLCEQMKFALSQYYISLIFPSFYGLLTASAIARIFDYPNIPIVTKTKDFCKEYVRLIKNAKTKFHALGLLQTVMILFLPYLQQKQLNNIMNKIKEETYIEELEYNL